MMKHTIRIGEKFGRLTVTGPVKMFSKQSGGRETRYGCRCECGNTGFWPPFRLRSGATKSCGCYARDSIRDRRTTHGATKDRGMTTTYRIYMGIITRCESPNNKFYSSYGGRGISVCNRWRYGENGLSGYECFVADMGTRPSKNLSLDRIDNDGNYEPGNCRWATSRQQSNNMRSNVPVIRSDGVRFPSMAEAARASKCWSNSIACCISGKQKTAGGYGWKKAEDNTP